MDEMERKNIWKKLIIKAQNHIEEISNDRDIINLFKSKKIFLEKGTKLYRARKLSEFKEKNINDLGIKKFTEDDFGPPPEQKITVGRCNTCVDKYFYLAKERYTALSEISPQKSDFVLIGEFSIKKDMELVDLTYDEKKDVNDENQINLGFYNPHLRVKKDYDLTNFISTVIKKTGYEGIQYSSSQAESGHNIVLFKNDKKKIEYEDYVSCRINSVVFIGKRSNSNCGKEFIIPNSYENAYGYEKAVDEIKFISNNKKEELL